MPKAMLSKIALASLCFLSPLAWAEPLFTCTYSDDGTPCLVTSQPLRGGGVGPPIYYIPGGVNENNIPEPHTGMDFALNPLYEVISGSEFGVTFPTSFTFAFFEQDGSLSDLVTGGGAITFDATPGDQPINCDEVTCITEDPGRGATATITLLLRQMSPREVPILSYLDLTIASDGEETFPPYPGGPDTSDYVIVDSRAIPDISQIPEPGSLALFGFGVTGLIGYGWTKKRFKHTQ